MVLKIVQKLLPRRLSGRTPDSESGKLGSSPRRASNITVDNTFALAYTVSMKYCIHVTLVASVEIEAKSAAEAKAIALASAGVTGANQFDSSAVVFETYPEPTPPRKGRGSY
jgi:hypothetical protein